MSLPKYLRWPLAILLVAHGAIHILGFLWAMDLVEIAELGGPTFIIGGGVPGDPAVVALGLVWLVSMMAFMAAGIGVALEARWGVPLAGIAAGISLVPTIVWWNDARMGALLSAAILIFAVVAAWSSDPTEPSAAEDREEARSVSSSRAAV